MDHSQQSALIESRIFGSVGIIRQTFSCAVDRKINLSGRMYVTASNICFYANLFGFEKKIRIPFSQINSIEKHDVALVGENICVKTAQKEYNFRSFYDRDEAYKVLTNLMDENTSNDPAPDTDLNNNDNNDNNDDNDNNDNNEFVNDYYDESINNNLLKTSSSSELDNIFDNSSVDSSTLENMQMNNKNRSRTWDHPALKKSISNSSTNSSNSKRTPPPAASSSRKNSFDDEIAAALVESKTRRSIYAAANNNDKNNNVKFAESTPPTNVVMNRSSEVEESDFQSMDTSVVNTSSLNPPPSDMKSAWENFKDNTLQHYKLLAVENYFLPVSVDEFFDFFVKDDCVFSTGRFHKEVRKDSDVSTEPWRSANEWGMLRNLTFRCPVNAPIGPSSTRATKRQRLHKFGIFGLIIETSTELEDVPSADCFTVEDFYLIEPSEDKKGITIRAEFEVKFVKSCMWRRIIESKTKVETSNWCLQFCEHMKKVIAEIRTGEKVIGVSETNKLEGGEFGSGDARAGAGVGGRGVNSQLLTLLLILVGFLCLICGVLVYLLMSLNSSVQQLTTLTDVLVDSKNSQCAT